MAYGIGSILLALLLVLMLSLASYGKNDRRSTNISGFRHIAAQVDTLTAAETPGEVFKVLVLHPDTRTGFSDLEKTIKSISAGGQTETAIEYYAWNDPKTATMLRDLRIRMSPGRTIVAFVAPNGAITWGGTDEMVSSVQAGAVFPSDGMCEIIESSQRGNDVLIVFSRDGATNGNQVIRTATDYVQTPANKAELFIIDPEDPANAEIVARTKLPPDSLKDARLLFMTAGRVRGQLTGAITSQALQGLKKSCSGKAGCC